jgi:hypothetical protein
MRLREISHANPSISTISHASSFDGQSPRVPLRSVRIMCQRLASLSVLMELRVNLISGVARKSKPGRLYLFSVLP